MGLGKEMLGEELAGNIVRLITNVRTCRLVLIDEGSVLSELTRDQNLKKRVLVCTGC